MPSLDALQDKKNAEALLAKAQQAIKDTQARLDKLAADEKAAKEKAVAEQTAAVVAAGGSSTDPANRLPGETAAQANARITAAYKAQPKPDLTQEGAAAGATIKFVREGAGGVGTYKEVFPIGTPVPTTRTTTSGNVYDAQGNLVSGTGLKTNTGKKTIFKEIPTINGGKIIVYSDGTQETIEGTADKRTVYKEFPLPNGGKIIVYTDGTQETVGPSTPNGSGGDNPPSGGGAVTEVSRTVNADGSTTITYSDGTTKVIPKISNTDPNGDPNITLISTYVDDATGDTIGYFSDGSRKVLSKGNGPTQSQAFKDAYSLLEATFKSYGLDELVPTIKDYMARNLGPEQAALELRSDPAYIKRFKGNDLRRAAGLNALSERDYLLTENAYDETLKAYGQQNYFGIDRATKQAKMAEIIGNDVSADEFKSRLDLAVSRVQNADPSIKETLKQFYPTLNDADLVGYFLNPTDALPKLEEKVTASEIGAAAKGQNLATDVASATDLAKYGITKLGAQKGYADIAEVLPVAGKLGDIYNEADIKYSQKTGEAEFFKSDATAVEKRRRLKSMERASFAGDSGVNANSLMKNTQGTF